MKVPANPDAVFLKVTQEKARDELQKRVNAGQTLLDWEITPRNRAEFLRLYARWTQENSELIRAFFTGGRLLVEYENSQMDEDHGGVGSPYDDGQVSWAKGYTRARMTALESILDRLPHFPLAAAGRRGAGASGNRVFIVHGRDELNLRRLKDLLHDRWDLDPLVLGWQPGMSRTLIEKFEEEADGCGFAFVLMTPDDQVRTEGGDYSQARPNAVFELGWFCGRLGRSNVVVLVKKGTQVHTDLDGLSRINFVEDVEEKVVEMERELTAAHIIPAQKTGAARWG